jgi:glycosidase
MTYAWRWTEKLLDIVHGEAPDLGGLFEYYAWDERAYPEDAYRMTFVTNHDINAWVAPAPEQWGPGLEAAIVLSVVGEGMPLVYSGQEAGNDRKLAFFERDTIEWRPHPMAGLYRKLFALLHDNTALWHGAAGGTMIRVWNSAPDRVLSFVRRTSGDQVFAVINFSGEERTLSFEERLHHGPYTEYFTGRKVRFDADSEIAVPAWGYRVYVR